MEGYISEIRMFAGNFEPRGWAFCQGQILSINENEALFSILGTTYGGNGQTTFALPDFRGRVALASGIGPGLSPYFLGEATGSESVTMTTNNLPPHKHIQNATTDSPVQNTAANASLASNARATNPPMPNIYAENNNNPVPMGVNTGLAGNGLPFSRVQPVLPINYVICLEGFYPSRG